MDMPAVYVLVDIHDVGLVAVPHFLHILPCQVCELAVGQLVVRRRVERYVQHRLLRVPVGKQVVLESPERVPHDMLRIARDIGNHAVARNDTCHGLVHFLLVVDDSPIERHAPVDFCHHVIPPPSVF